MERLNTMIFLRRQTCSCFILRYIDSLWDFFCENIWKESFPVDFSLNLRGSSLLLPEALQWEREDRHEDGLQGCKKEGRKLGFILHFHNRIKKANKAGISAPMVAFGEAPSPFPPQGQPSLLKEKKTCPLFLGSWAFFYCSMSTRIQSRKKSTRPSVCVCVHVCLHLQEFDLPIRKDYLLITSIKHCQHRLYAVILVFFPMFWTITVSFQDSSISPAELHLQLGRTFWCLSHARGGEEFPSTERAEWGSRHDGSQIRQHTVVPLTDCLGDRREMLLPAQTQGDVMTFACISEQTCRKMQFLWFTETKT